MNMDFFKNNKKVLLIIGVCLLVLASIGLSYAYFTAAITGSANENVVTTGTMIVEFDDGTPNVTGEKLYPGQSVTKSFSVKNIGNVTALYDIYINDIINTFVDKNDLVFELTSTNNGATIEETVMPSSNIKIASNVGIEVGTTQEYTFTITFKETNDNQDDNRNVAFSGKIDLKESNTKIQTRVVYSGLNAGSYEDYNELKNLGITYMAKNTLQAKVTTYDEDLYAIGMPYEEFNSMESCQEEIDNNSLFLGFGKKREFVCEKSNQSPVYILYSVYQEPGETSPYKPQSECNSQLESLVSSRIISDPQSYCQENNNLGYDSLEDCIEEVEDSNQTTQNIKCVLAKEAPFELTESEEVIDSQVCIISNDTLVCASNEGPWEFPEQYYYEDHPEYISPSAERFYNQYNGVNGITCKYYDGHAMNYISDVICQGSDHSGFRYNIYGGVAADEITDTYGIRVPNYGVYDSEQECENNTYSDSNVCVNKDNKYFLYYKYNSEQECLADEYDQYVCINRDNQYYMSYQYSYSFESLQECEAENANNYFNDGECYIKPQIYDFNISLCHFNYNFNSSICEVIQTAG